MSFGDEISARGRRHDPITKGYIARRIAEDKTSRDAFPRLLQQSR